MRTWSVVWLGLFASTAASAAPVTVFLERDGETTARSEIPRFGGGDRTWREVVACVQHQFAPFALDVVDERPARGHFITVVIGGRPDMLGIDDPTTDGDAPYTGRVMRDAVVHVFSQAGTGERDVDNLCANTAHEVGHALGLDHELHCSDIMSASDRCRVRTFVDIDAPCGETRERTCDNGDESQSSYRRLVELVGLRERTHHARRHRRRPAAE